MEFNGRIKEWFIDKNLNDNQRYLYNTGDLYIARETEKALQIEVSHKVGNFKFWVPKSCLMNEEDFQREREYEEKREAKMADGLAYNEMLVEFAKANGVEGVRRRMKTKTLIEKIVAAGLEVPSRQVA